MNAETGVAGKLAPGVVVPAPAFVARPNDVYIASYPRSGTTWMQMIVHTLLRPGDTSFRHISQVIPFFDRAVRQGRWFDELPSPRVFKTHLQFRHLNGRPGRYVYVLRDGRDVAVSYFHFHRTYLGSSESFAEFFERFLNGRVLYGSWFRHVAAWTAHASDDNVCMVGYEDLCTDFTRAVQRLAAFLGVTLTAETHELIAARCTFAAMRAHEKQLDPIGEQALEGHAVGESIAGGFLRQGRAGAWTETLTAAQESMFAEAVRRGLADAARVAWDLERLSEGVGWIWACRDA